MSEDRKTEEGKYWYTDTEFPGIKVRMDGIREFVIDANFGLSDAQIERLMNGVGYWFLKRASIMFPSPAASPVSDAVEFGKWLSENGYRPCDRLWGTWENDADIEIEFTSEELYQIFKSENPTPTNVQEQDELWEELIKVVEINQFLSTKYKEVIDKLKSKYTITKKQ